MKTAETEDNCSLFWMLTEWRNVIGSAGCNYYPGPELD